MTTSNSQPILKRAYQWPSTKLSRSNLVAYISTFLVYFWTTLLGIALVGFIVARALQHNVVTDLWVNIAALALIGTFFCVPILFVASKLQSAYIGAMMCFFFGITLLLYERCSYCNEIISRVDAGFYRDFTRDELISYIFASQYAHEQLYFGTVLIFLGIFLLTLTVIIAQSQRG